MNRKTTVVLAVLSSIVVLPLVAGCSPKEQAKSRADEEKSMYAQPDKMPAEARQKMQETMRAGRR